MKYITLLCFLIISIADVWAQHDTLRGYYQDGTLKFEQVKQDGIRDGHYKRWYSSGVLMMHTNWELDVQEGIQLHYYESGALQSRYIFKCGKAILIRSYHENRSKMGISRTNGCKIREKEWTIEGSLLRKIKSKGEITCISELPSVNDSLNDPMTKCYCGNIEVKSNDDSYHAIDGTKKERKVKFKKLIFYENGQKKYESRFIRGKGFEREWDNKGELIKETIL
jgi:antitoxin component YwqK of YwqJK toxin-antitoxin module